MGYQHLFNTDWILAKNQQSQEAGGGTRFVSPFVLSNDGRSSSKFGGLALDPDPVSPWAVIQYQHSFNTDWILAKKNKHSQEAGGGTWIVSPFVLANDGRSSSLFGGLALFPIW